MRIGLATDATCDLPQDFVARHGITILPVTIRLDGQLFIDVRDPKAAEGFSRGAAGRRAHAAVVEAPTVDAIRDVFLDRLVLDYDAMFCLAASSSRNDMFANVTDASFAILGSYRAVRRAAGNDSAFLMRVIDTRSMFAGQAVGMIAAMRMIDAGAGFTEIRTSLSSLAAHTYAYALPRELSYMRAGARTGSDRGVGLMDAMLGSALDVKPVLRCFHGTIAPVARVRGFAEGCRRLFAHAAAAVARGLLVPAMCISYGGPLAALRVLPGYRDLVERCAERGVRLYPSVMSIAGMVDIGTGALSVGYAVDQDDTPP